MRERKTFKSLVKNQLDKFASFILEEEEIIDDGLDKIDTSLSSNSINTTDNIETKEETVEFIKENDAQQIEETVDVTEVKKEVEEVKQKNKNSFFKTKSTKTLEEDLFKPEETKTTMELIKENPVPTVEIIEIKEPDKKFFQKSTFKYEKAKPVENEVTDELTEEQKEEKAFYDKLDASESILNTIRKNVLFKDIEDKLFDNDFEKTFFDLLDAIEENQTLERFEKVTKKANLLEDLMKTQNTEEEIYDYFTKIHHELHKAKNSLGEYSSKVRNNPDLQEDIVLEYRIPDMYENPKYRKLLLKSDIQSFSELISLVDVMYTKLDNNKYVTNEKRKMMQSDYTDLMWSSNSLFEILKNIELLKYDLNKLENEVDEFSKTGLALN